MHCIKGCFAAMCAGDMSPLVPVSTNSPIDSLFHFYEKLGVIVLTLTISNVTNPNPNPIERHENNKVVFIYVICSI